MGNQVLNIAHRGASGYVPENTMEAFKYSVELGATAIESDVQMTKDGYLVLIHDESLLRTTGVHQLVKDTTLEEIQQLDAGSWMDKKYHHVRIPTLTEFLTWMKPLDLGFNLELKNGVVMYPELEEAVIEEIRKHDVMDRMIISSFNHYSLVKCKKLAPELQTGVLYMEGLYEPWNYAKSIGASALHAYHYAVLPELVTEASANDVVYHPFTVNDPNEMKQLVNAGVAGIITDYPDRLDSILRNSVSNEVHR